MSEQYKQYISVDSRGCIIDGWSAGFCPEKSKDGAILLTDCGGYHFALLGEDNPKLFSDVVPIPLYKWDGARVIPRTEAEMQADRAALPPAPPADGERIAALEDAVCEQDSANAQRLADIENALCEMDTAGKGV